MLTEDTARGVLRRRGRNAVAIALSDYYQDAALCTKAEFPARKHCRAERAMFGYVQMGPGAEWQPVSR